VRAPHKPATFPFGRFDVEARIGQGGMCEVFSARVREGTEAGQVVAIKRLSPQMSQNAEAVEMFLAEAEVSHLLRHPNIIRVFESGRVGESYYIAMELVDGRDLGAILQRCRKRNILLPADFLVYLTAVLLDALDFAHHARSPEGTPLGLIHCDVSPGNVFISRNGEIKLGDFGIARVHRFEQPEVGIWGKPYYLAPEIFEGQAPNAGTDIWAAAVILYELLTNRRPFGGDSLETVSVSVRGEPPESPIVTRPEMSPVFAEVVVTALRREADLRFPSAQTFREALAPFCDDRIGTQMAIAAVVRNLFRR
jgi:eukaryotic-like serine/threonine-protein kinase